MKLEDIVEEIESVKFYLERKFLKDSSMMRVII